MKRLVNILIIALLPLAAIAQPAAPSADEVLNRFLQKIDAQTLSSSFTITHFETANSPITLKGTMKIRGEKYRMSVADTEAAYDGKTLYIYKEQDNELTITTPLTEEVLEANPFLFARELQKESRVRFSSTNKDQKLYVIELIPSDPRVAGSSKVTIKIRRSDWTPVEIVEREGESKTTITFSDAAYSSDLPSFTISHPNAYINDLR